MKKERKIHYDTVKVSYGMYIIDEVRKQTNKDHPTETDVKKLLQQNAKQHTEKLSAAKQISRYCKTNHDYLLKAKEETFNSIARAINLPVQHFNQFHECINQLYKKVATITRTSKRQKIICCSLKQPMMKFILNAC